MTSNDNDNFSRVQEKLKKGGNLFITGTAGSGKSYLLKQLKDYYGRTFHLTASTGISALNINGTTIHSWAKLGIGANPEDRIAKMIAKDQKCLSKILSCRYLAIDEISMISDKLLYLLHKVLVLVRKNTNPFGGVQLILLGDFLQLPPVLKDDESLCLNSQIWLHANIETVLLTTNFRQKDDTGYFSLLKDIRKGINVDHAHYKLQDRVGQPYPEDVTRLVSHRDKVREINQIFLDRITLPVKTYKGKYTGSEMDINAHKSPYIEMEEIEFKKGSKVMLNYNVSLKDGLVNGLIGSITSFSPNGLPVVLFENGDEIEVRPMTWEIEDSTGRVIFSFTQLPLQLAWAVTIHKSQGCTFSNLHIDLSKCFADGQAYVALSRVKSLEGLYLEPFDRGRIRTNKLIVDYYNYLEEATK